MATDKRAAAGGTDVADWLHLATVRSSARSPSRRLGSRPGFSETWLNLLEQLETELAGERGGNTGSAAAG
jgi:hypothetical protein